MHHLHCAWLLSKGEYSSVALPENMLNSHASSEAPKKEGEGEGMLICNYA